MANNQSVRRHLDAFTRGRIVGKLEEGRSVTEARRNRRQTAREIARHTRHRRLDDRYLVLPWPEDCTVVVCLHDALYDDSRFSLSSDSHRILIWRERGSRNPSLEHHSKGQRRYGSAVPFHGRQCTMSSHSSSRTALRERLAARTVPPVTIRELRLALEDEWAAMPQQLIDTLILSMDRRCETCQAVRGNHIPY
ncbi:hypothetical protein TNCV_3258041 [Trichonephila clavipes]|nr:hypothetical protein TNCV_3258041 [Trichonephila clavipes]